MVLVLAALFAAAPAGPPAADLNFTIRNHSSYTVDGLYWSGCNATNWQPLPLQRTAFPDGVVYPGQSVVYALNPGCVNLMLTTREGAEFHYGVQVTNYDVYEWPLYDGEATFPDEDYYGGYGYVEVRNENGYEDVKDVFFRECGTSWDSDYLVEGEFIRLSGAHTFELPTGCWDAAVRLTSGQVMNWTDLVLDPDATLRLRVPPSH